MLQALYRRLENWHRFPAILPTRVGTNEDGSPRKVWGRMLERRIHVHYGYSDVEYRLPGSTDSWVGESACCLEAPAQF